MSDLESGVRRRAKPRIRDPRDKAPPTRRRYLLSDVLPKYRRDRRTLPRRTHSHEWPVYDRTPKVAFTRLIDPILSRWKRPPPRSVPISRRRLSSYLIILNLIAIDVPPSGWPEIVEGSRGSSVFSPNISDLPRQCLSTFVGRTVG